MFVIILICTMFVYADGFGDAFGDTDTAEFNNAEQAELELILRLEACKETPDTEACQIFFLEYGEQLDVDLTEYVLPKEDNAEPSVTSETLHISSKSTVEDQDITEINMTKTVETTGKRVEKIRYGIAPVGGRLRFQTLEFVEYGAAVFVESEELTFRTSASGLATNQAIPVLDEDGLPTDVLEQSWRVLLSIEQAILCSMNLGGNLAPYFGGAVTLVPQYAGVGSGVATGLTAMAGFNRIVVHKPNWRFSLKGEVEAGMLFGQYFGQVPSPAGGTLSNQGSVFSLSLYPAIEF